MKSIIYLTVAILLSACAAEVITIPAGVILDQSSATLVPGETLRLTPNVIPDEAAIKTVSWSSSNPHVATVTDGVVTAIIEGTSIITVTTNSGQRTAYFLLTVAYPVSHVVLDETVAILTVGQSQRLTATVFPEHVHNQNVSWISSNPDVVEVIDGIITAKALGTATVSVVTEIGSRVAVCSVRVVSDNHIAMTTTISSNNMLHLRIAGSGAIRIDWGDGSPIQMRSLSPSLIMFSHFYSGSPPFVITIEGDNITNLICSGSQLTNLDVSRITGLIYLNCANNQLTSLDVSNNLALTNLNCSNNQLSADALNALFKTLPIPQDMSPRWLDIGNNPGTAISNWSIATDRGWFISW